MKKLYWASYQFIVLLFSIPVRHLKVTSRSIRDKKKLSAHMSIYKGLFFAWYDLYNVSVALVNFYFIFIFYSNKNEIIFECDTREPVMSTTRWEYEFCKFLVKGLPTYMFIMPYVFIDCLLSTCFPRRFVDEQSILFDNYRYRTNGKFGAQVLDNNYSSTSSTWQYIIYCVIVKSLTLCWLTTTWCRYSISKHVKSIVYVQCKF